MLKRSCLKSVVAASVVSLLVLAQSAHADLMNGEFIDNLSPWTVDPTGAVLWIDADAADDGEALFIPDDQELYPESTLSQIFTLDPESLTLSFDFVMDIIAETDIFTASLLDDQGDALGPFSDEADFFYFLDSKGEEHKAAEVVVTGDTVSLDVSSWAGEEVKLVFNLQHDYTDGEDTYVSLDNVAVSIIPAPGDGNERMPMVRRGDHDGVDILATQKIAEVAIAVTTLV